MKDEWIYKIIGAAMEVQSADYADLRRLKKMKDEMAEIGDRKSGEGQRSEGGKGPESEGGFE
jgi:hypothetical protein